MTEYWKKYWDEHVERTGDNPFQQVARTQNKESMSEEMFREFVQTVIEKLELDGSQTTLDLCCGNGILSVKIAEESKEVTGVDFSEKLIAHKNFQETTNLKGIVADVIKLQFEPESFDRVIMAAALQHFTYAETIYLYENIFQWLKEDGIFLATDIIDNDKIWSFYNTEEREKAYFNQLSAGSPIMGTWFQRNWLEKLAKYAGFAESQALDQHETYWYSHYRFDFLCRKKG